MEKIRIYRPDEIEHIRLQLFANLANGIFLSESDDPHDYRIEIGTTYFDYGQNWKYTALITKDYNVSANDLLHKWQSVCPRDYKEIIECDSISMMKRFAENYAKCLIEGKPIKIS